MTTKTRDISPHDFLQALQKEYICLEIRSKIYLHKNDKDYFRTLMVKKEEAIFKISKKNRLVNIIEDGEEYIRVWQEIVPEFGFPKLIYNIVNVSKKQLEFPYKGTVVKNVINDKVGITQQVNFKENEVVIQFNDSVATIPFCDTQRLNHKQTDEYFYYYPDNEFQCSFEDGNKLGILKSYDLKNKLAEISLKSAQNLITLHRSKISRIL